MPKYHYFNDVRYPILVSDSTLRLTPHTWSVSSDSMWESESIRRFFETIPNDKKVNIIDVGAQTGLYTLFAKYRPAATFYAFEPFQPTFEALKENLVLNDINNVIVYNAGVSDNKGTVTLNTSASHNGLHTLGSTPLRFNDTVPVTVNVDTIDNLFIDTPIDYIKIDTEGWEYHILQGADKVLTKYKPHIQLEWNITNMQQCGVDPVAVQKYLSELGYVQVALISEELFMSHSSRMDWAN